MISLIVAIANNNVIGNEGKLPWYLPNDLQYFKQVTDGHKLIMGRKTFESLPGILPNRFHIVLSRQDMQVRSPMVRFFKTKEEILKVLSPDEEVFVIGGAEIFDHFRDVSNKLYITRIMQNFDGDVRFPNILSDPGWRLTSTITGVVNEKNPIKHYFELYEKPGYRYDLRGG